MAEGKNNEEKEGQTLMKEKIMDTFKKIAKIMSYYRTLLILWFVLGIFVMACGDISRLNYFCVWICVSAAPSMERKRCEYNDTGQ